MSSHSLPADPRERESRLLLLLLLSGRSGRLCLLLLCDANAEAFDRPKQEISWKHSQQGSPRVKNKRSADQGQCDSSQAAKSGIGPSATFMDSAFLIQSARVGALVLGAPPRRRIGAATDAPSTAAAAATAISNACPKQLAQLRHKSGSNLSHYQIAHNTCAHACASKHLHQLDP